MSFLSCQELFLVNGLGWGAVLSLWLRYVVSSTRQQSEPEAGEASL